MSAQDERIVDLWQARKDAAQDLRNLYEDRWVSNWEMYRNVRKTRSFNRSQRMAQIPDAFRMIETLVPHAIRGMFRSNDWFTVESPSAPPDHYAKLVKSLLLHGWRKADGYRKTVEGVKMGSILGHFIPKVHWNVELGEKQVLDFGLELGPDGEPIVNRRRVTVPDVRHNGPQISLPDLMNVWQDPSGKEQWFIERIDASVSSLKQDHIAFDKKLYKNLNQLADAKAMSKALRGRGGYGDNERPSLKDRVEGISDYLSQDADHVELWQCWGRVPEDVKKYDDTQWRLQVVADGTVLLRDERAPTPDHRPPYINVQSIPIPGQIYGDSVLTYTEDLINQRSEIENMRMHEVKQQIFGTHAVHADAQIDGKMFKEPGGYLKIRPPFGQRLADVFQNIPRHPILNEAYAESAAKERQMLDASGATEPFQGSFAAGGSHRTASEFEGTVSLGSARVELATLWMDESFKKPLLQRMFRFYQARLDDPQMIALAGNPHVSGEVDLNDLEWDVDIYVDSGLFGSMNATTMQNLNQFISTAYASPETAIWIDPRKLMGVISHRLGVTGMDDVMRSSEDVEAIQQQQFEQQAMLALAGGSGADGGGGAPQG